jgi:hypothetical protein
MTISTEEASPAMTIGDLRSKDMRLGLRCGHCSRFRYMADTRFPEETVVAKIAETLKCARCGSKEVETFPVARSPVNGYWPAESS